MEAEVNKELGLLSKDLQTELKKVSKNDKILKIQDFNKASAKVVNTHMDNYSLIVSLYQGKVASYKAGRELALLKPIFAKYQATNTLIRMEAKTKGYDAYYQALLKKRRIQEFGGYTFTERIKTVKSGSTKVVRAIVQNGVRQRKSVKDIAKSLDVYVKPVGKQSISPFNVIRKSLGRPTTYTPRGVPAGSMQHNALRIARTETAYTYRQATVDYYKDEPFVKGYKWVLSNSHTVIDICNDWAAKDFYKKDGSDLPAGHPNCVCDTQSALISDAEMKKLGLD